MPVTRLETQKQIEDAKQYFELPFIDPESNKLTLRRLFKKKVNHIPKTDDFWVNLNRKTFLLLTRHVSLPRENNEDILYAEMLEHASMDEDETIHFELQGLQSVCHKKLCLVLLKKFQVKKPKGIPNMTINIENISIPHNPLGKGHIFPPVKIKVESLTNVIKFSLSGESSMIFLLYHLDKIIQSFLLEIPVNIENLYTFPSQSSTSEVLDQTKVSEQDISTSEIIDQIKGPEQDMFENMNFRNEEHETDDGCISPIIVSTRAKLLKSGPIPTGISTSNIEMSEDNDESEDEPKECPAADVKEENSCASCEQFSVAAAQKCSNTTKMGFCKCCHLLTIKSIFLIFLCFLFHYVSNQNRNMSEKLKFKNIS